MELVATSMSEIELPEHNFLNDPSKDLTPEGLNRLAKDKAIYSIDMMSDILHEPPNTIPEFTKSGSLQRFDDRYINWVEQLDRYLNLLHNGKKVKFEFLMDMSREILQTYQKVPFYLLNLINKRVAGDQDLFIAYHSINVAILSIAVGIQAEYGTSQLLELTIAALLHDVGHKRSEKRVMVDEYLEFDALEQFDNHAVEGLALLKNLTKVPVTTAFAVFHHHEFHDGGGRINNTPSNEIHDFVSIIQIANQFETRCRFHTPNKSIHFLIQDGKIALYHKRFFSIFISTLSIFPIGSWVITDRNEVCKVVGSRTGSIQNPILASIFIIQQGKIESLAHKEFYNTNPHNQVKITKTFRNEQLETKMMLGF
ncbi:MAG: HD domain-containing protein [Fibrobacterales bacterium]